MAKQKTYQLMGELNWTKLQFPDEYLGKKSWSVALTMDKTSLAKFKESGSKLKVRDESTITLKKPVEPPRNWKSEWGQVEIWYNGERDDSLVIGNGSTGICTIEVYDTPYGKGTRLVKIDVLKHVPYRMDNEEGNSEPEVNTETKEETVEKAPW